MSLEELRKEKEIFELIEDMETLSIKPETEELELNPLDEAIKNNKLIEGVRYDEAESSRINDRELEITRRHYYRGHRRQLRRINLDEEFIPQYRNTELIGGAGAHLNIDCAINTEELIDDYLIENTMLSKESKESVMEAYTRLLRTYKGTVKNWIYNVTGRFKNDLLNGTSTETFWIRVEELLRKEFLGKELIGDQEQQNKDKDEAIRNINRLCISDICYLEQYTCEFRKYFYQLKVTDWQDPEYTFYASMYYNKLPKEVPSYT